MGYWSEVAIKCKPKAYKMFEVFLGKEIFPDKIYRHVSNTHILYWELGRWDESDEEVQRITELMADTRRDLADYYDEITRMDGHIGRMISVLEKKTETSKPETTQMNSDSIYLVAFTFLTVLRRSKQND